MKGVAAALVVFALGLAGCSSDDSQGLDEPDRSATTSPSPAKTITLIPPSPVPLSGTLTAELQQSSRDVALGRFQVWITNGLDHAISPTKIVYRDAQLSRPVTGGRLRTIPSGSYRGYTLDLIEPRCGADRGQAKVTVSYDDGVDTFPVEDETGVVQRWAHERCDELAISRIAHLEWTTGIRTEGSGSDAVAMFRLTATPAGRSDGSITVDTVGGTPLFTSADGDFWTVGKTIRGVGPPVTMELPAQPARCDAHAFGSATGGTTFFVNVTVHAGSGDGSGERKAQIRLAMSPEVTAETFAYAAETCGWDE